MNHYLLLEARLQETERSYATVLIWDESEVTCFSSKKPFCFRRGVPELPSSGVLAKWSTRLLNYEEAMELEELLLVLRLPLSTPRSTSYGDSEYRLRIQNRQQALMVQWNGDSAPLHWRPLNDLVRHLERIRQIPPGTASSDSPAPANC